MNEETGQEVHSFTIATTQANGAMKPLHDRMPVLLDEAGARTWLGGDEEHPEALLKPAPDEWLASYPVSTRINSPANDEPACMAPLVTEQ